jgi:hypothetical protein
MTELSRGFKRLSLDEARHALYIDFEGRKDQAPVVLGVLRRRGRGQRPWVQQVIVDETFASLGLSTLSLGAAVEAVVMRAERRDRRIVSWSEHDLEVVRTLREEAPELVERFEARYANALAVAKRWRTLAYDRKRPEDGRLVSYLALIEYVVPDEAVGGDVGETIRIMRPRLESAQPLTERHWKRWNDLLEHNRHDCAGMKRVCVLAAAELDALAA